MKSFSGKGPAICRSGIVAPRKWCTQAPSFQRTKQGSLRATVIQSEPSAARSVRPDGRSSPFFIALRQLLTRFCTLQPRYSIWPEAGCRRVFLFERTEHAVVQSLAKQNSIQPDFFGKVQG